jgi:hypothetical protein
MMHGLENAYALPLDFFRMSSARKIASLWLDLSMPSAEEPKLGFRRIVL